MSAEDMTGEINMDRRWYKAWPLWVPKSFDAEKSTSEYIREWAEMKPEGVAISFYGAHAPFEVAGLMEFDKEGRIQAFHIVTDTAFIRPIFEKETGFSTARSDWW
jgi:hypothetical protein